MRCMRYILILLSSVLFLPEMVSAQLLPSFGRDRAGTSGFQFLKIPVDARSAGMGYMVPTSDPDVGSLFWNPALASRGESRMQIGLGHTVYHAGIALDYAGAIYDFGGLSLGASLQTLNSGEMDVTTEFEPFGTGETFRAIDLAAGLTISQSLTDIFSYGVTAKYARESIASVHAHNVLFDLGVFYQVGTTGAAMSVAIRNFGPDASTSGSIERLVVSEAGSIIEEDFQALAPPTTFLLGFSYQLLQNDANQDLLLLAQLNNPNDNAESLHLGAEYIWNNWIVLRSGYRFGVEEANLPSFGFGLILPGLGPDAQFDYGFNRLERLGSIHRIGLNLQL